MPVNPLLVETDAGLYCPDGGFHIDPWKGVERAVITHAHADHARWGSKRYLGSRDGEHVLRQRLGKIDLQTLDYGEPLAVNGVMVSLHPAGHILGSAQVRVERGGEVWVVTGDYKVEPDKTCKTFEPVRCHTFISESTFGLPVYRWQPQEEIFADINRWWRQTADEGRACILYAYALGKSQRLLAGLDPSIGPIYCHGAVETCNRGYRAAGVGLPATLMVSQNPKKGDWGRAMVMAPPSAQRSPWTRKFGEAAVAFASGWMRVRGARRRRVVDRGFVLSDHADWPGLNAAIEASGASRVYVTHGFTAIMSRWLTDRGLEAHPLKTLYEGERDEAAGEPEEDAVADAPAEQTAAEG